MTDSIQLFARYAAVSFRSQLQYRASFVMMSAGHFLVVATEFAGLWLLFERFGSLKGWSRPEVALLYGIVHVAFALAEGIGRGFDTFGSLVREGEFDRLLLRPRSTAFQVAAREIQLMRVGRLLQGLLVLGWSMAALGIAWTPAKALLLLGTIAGGACMFYGLLVIQATVAFWTVESLELLNTVTYGGVETAQFPLSIYRSWFRAFFTFVIPLACVNYLPAHALLGRSDILGSPGLVQWLAPLAGVLFLALSLQVWKLGVRHYCSTGS
jgi:ABC-2 type transport system permease protein